MSWLSSVNVQAAFTLLTRGLNVVVYFFNVGFKFYVEPNGGNFDVNPPPQKKTNTHHPM